MVLHHIKANVTFFKKILLAAFVCWALILGVIKFDKRIQLRLQQEAETLFHQVLSENDKEIMNDLVDVFLEMVKKHNLTYWLYSGSLIGSWRHHGIVPWDDDIDFILPSIESKIVKRYLENLPEGFNSYTGVLPWKLFSVKSAQIITLQHTVPAWKYPFIDIFFYDEDIQNGVLRDSIEGFGLTFNYQKEDIFPLTKRPFIGRLLNAPKNTQKVVRKTYDYDKCETTLRTHKTETELVPISISCSYLKEYYPFVVRQITPQGINETLQLNGTVLSWWLDHY